MMRSTSSGWRMLVPVLVLSVLGFAMVVARADVLIPNGAEWLYRLARAEASSPAEAWRKPVFPDSDWSAGSAPIGYGELETNTSIPSSAAGNWLSVYLRRSFIVPEPARISELRLSVRIDDGFVAWINGIEVARHNVPDGPLAFNATARSPIEPVTVSVALTNRVLVPGTNLLAIHAFNANSGSSDFVLDAQLVSTSDLTAPAVVALVPAAGVTVRELRQVEVIFDESVSGVDAMDLLVNGAPATSVSAASPRDYIFSFPPPPPGPVQLSWAADHQIVDSATPPNPFQGGTWKYTIDPAVSRPLAIISELMADNAAGIRDEDGNRSDWIEISNLGSEPIDLEGWFLTDDPLQPAKWRFPAQTISPNTYLLVWASEKNRTDPAAPLHTNFKLADGGEYLALLDASTNVISAFAPAYPPQQPNVSYGRDRVDPGLAGYFATPTPGAANSTSGPGFAPGAEFSLPGGVYTDAALTVALSAPAGEIHYTLDGSSPTLTSPLYTIPITFSGNTVLQARVFQPGMLPGPIGVQIYTFAAADFTSNLPVLVINTAGRGISQDQRVRAFISAFEPSPRDGRTRLLNQPSFESVAQIEIRGQTSAGFDKQPYNLELNDPYGNDQEAPLLGLPEESDWVLHNPYSDKCLMNNFLAFELFRAMGNYAPRCRFVEVFVKTARTRLSYPGDYRGVYVLMEKIKVDPNRVDLARLTPAHDREPEITGGYIVKKDKDSPGDLNFTTAGGPGFGGQSLKYHEPKPREITAAQRSWIVQYLNQFERALYASDWLRRTGTNHYSNFIDLESFVDYHWIVEFTKQIDGYRLSNYMSKDRGAKLKMAPIWDWNLSLGNADYLDGWKTNGWYYPLISANDHIWLRRLITGVDSGNGTQGDPDFNQRIADRWSVLRTNVLAASNVTARINAIAATLNEAQVRDFARYPRLNTYVWPNPSFYIAPTYSAIIAAMKRWVQGRFSWIDSQYTQAPEFSAAGGQVMPGDTLTMSAAAGTVYFTIDGTDPRLPGGNVNPAARPYSGQSLLFDRNMRVFARARTGTKWSGPTVGTFVVQTPPLVITELMYHPRPTAAAATGEGDRLEFIELKNTGAADLDLTGFRFSAGVEYTFTSASSVTRLPPGGFVLLVKDRAAFAARYPEAAAQVAGEYHGSLDNRGEQLSLEGPLQEPILDFSYSPEWAPISDGAGFSLAVVNDRAPVQEWSTSPQWRASARSGGSPGADDPSGSLVAPVLINEIVARTQPPDVDAVELYNPGNTAVDVGGWFLSDDFTNPQKYRLPGGTIVPPGGYLTLTESMFGADPNTGFALSANGDEIYLFSGDGAELTGWVHGFAFGASEAAVSFGRHVTGTGEEYFPAQLRTTLGEPNAGPIVGPVVISELMFQPPAFGTANNALDEYIELANITATPALLSDPGAPTNSWRLGGGVDFDFPANATIGPGGFALVVSFSPGNATALAEFRAVYGLDATTPIYGPYRGSLANDGERVTLSRGATVQNRSEHIEVDELRYETVAPWPSGATGSGESLQRVRLTDYAPDPANWWIADPTPGRPNSALSIDSDGDGLPDAWERSFIGGLSARPDEDPDGDGATNFEEFRSGTRPNDGSSRLQLQAAMRMTGRTVIRFYTAAARAYRVLSSDTVTGPWRNRAEVQAGSVSGETAIAVESSAEQQWYQLEVR